MDDHKCTSSEEELPQLVRTAARAPVVVDVHQGADAVAGRMPRPPHLPPFKDAWDADFMTHLADDLAYAELKSRLDTFASARDISMFDFLEAPNMHVPLLYMDVRNRIRFREGAVPSSSAFREGLARALYLLLRVYQDTCACEQAMGTANVSHIPAMFHAKLCAWISGHFRSRDLVLASPRPRRGGGSGGSGGGAGGSAHGTGRVRPKILAADGPPSARGGGSNGMNLLRGRLGRHPVADDYLSTGWPSALSFQRVVARVKELAASSTAPLPLPVWVPRVYRSALPGSFTIYFQDALPTMKAAATNNQKIKAVRRVAATTMLEALSSLRTWRGFQALRFTTATASAPRHRAPLRTLHVAAREVARGPDDEASVQQTRGPDTASAAGFMCVVPGDCEGSAT